MNRHRELRWSDLRWWHCGLGGMGAAAGYACVGVLLVIIVDGFKAVLQSWDGLGLLAVYGLAAGFVTGSFVGLIRGLSKRFGRLGDALIGALIVNLLFVLGGVAVRRHEILPPDIVTVLNTSFAGAIVGLWVGDLVRGEVKRERVAEQERRVLYDMRLAGRFIPWHDLVPRLQQGDGTLIVEQGLMAAHRVWWTPDDLHQTAPMPPPLESYLRFRRTGPPHPFIGWCHATYLSVDDGQASLTKPNFRLRAGPIRSTLFRDKFPDLNIVMTVKQD